MRPERFPVPFLITRETRVKLADINPLYDQPEDRIPPPAADDRYARGSFAIPGRTHSAADTPSVTFDGEALNFPNPGEYYFYSDHGAFKFLILPPHPSVRDLILLIAQFVARNSVHSLADHWLSMTDPDCAFDARLLAQKFFASDQPLQLYCGEITPFLAALLHQFGVTTRQVHLFDAGDDGHVVLEAFDPVDDCWLMMDTDYGVYVADPAGRILSTAEFLERRRSGAEVLIVDIAQKRWLTREYAAPGGFFGQKTWHPGCDSEFAPADAGFYRALWEKWVRVAYHDYFFSPDGWGISYHDREPVVSDAIAGGAGRLFDGPADRFRIVGQIHLKQCPVCSGEQHPTIWQIPQARLSQPAALSAPGQPYDNMPLIYLPMLATPQQIFRFDLCETCAAIFLNPTGDAREAYSNDASKVEWVRHKGIRAWWDAAAAFMRFAPETIATVVDAACGAGELLANARDDQNPGLRVIGLEISRPAVDFMRHELGIEAHAVDLDVDDLDEYVEPGSVDFIIFNEGYEHMRFPTVVLRKLLRLLRSGGRIRFSAEAYGPQLDRPIRPGPILVSDKTLDWTVRETNTVLVSLEYAPTMYVTLEKR
jgi:hypothetical protein